IVEFDWSVGQIIKTLEECNLDQNTLVLVCSDNGPVLDDGYQDRAIEDLGDHDPNGPFRGGKYNVYEGGVRTPMIAWWPGKISPRVSNEMICTIDYPKTLASLAGVQVANGDCPDSVDLSSLLLDPNGKGRDSLVVQDNGQSGSFGYREGRWKLVRCDSQRANNVELRLTPTKLPRYQLFDLESDPSESNDLFEEKPEQAQSMIGRLQKTIDGR
ncbi:MAG: sulfatase-like hydrolase/transferase, partial [Planctomycetaceae bacterium]|nr:sulfatase-like hydrolase/transferase [Planctomycetaceae bacterium]